MTYNPLDHILTIRVPPRAPREPPPPSRTLRAKVLLVTSSRYDLRQRFGNGWKDAVRPGIVVEEVKTFRSTKQASMMVKKFGTDNLVVYCHSEKDVHPFVIAVGITKGCTIQNATVSGRWEILATGFGWERPLRSPEFPPSSDSADHVLRKKLCRVQWFFPVPKFWTVYDSLLRSRDLNGGTVTSADLVTNEDAKRLVMFVEKAFGLSPESWQVFRSAAQIS